MIGASMSTLWLTILEGANGGQILYVVCHPDAQFVLCDLKEPICHIPEGSLAVSRTALA